MLNIKESDLELLLKDRKKEIEIPKLYGISDIFAAISLGCSLFCTDASSIRGIPPIIFFVIMGIIILAFLILGIAELIKSIFRRYTVNALYLEIKDLDPIYEHRFNIVIIRNMIENGKYLLFKSGSWNCWLFPNYKCMTGCFDVDRERKEIEGKIKDHLNISNEMHIEYLGNQHSTKYSYNDKVYKRYNFHFFLIEGINVGATNKTKFEINSRKYCWKTISQMQCNPMIMKKNQDVVDFVRKNCDLN